MPVREYVESPHTPEAQGLLQELVGEWDHPSERDDPQTPVILIKRREALNALHIYVVWDSWADMDQAERSEIIMDACEKHLGEEQTLKVTVAMGLTRDEAVRMGIDYR